MIHIFMVALVGQWQQLTGGGLFQNEMNIIRRIVVFAVWLWLLLFVHSIAMVVFEGMSLADALWLSITTITTVGYGDYTATTFLGRASTVVLLYIGGISLLAALASDYVDYRIARRERVNDFSDQSHDSQCGNEFRVHAQIVVHFLQNRDQLLRRKAVLP